MQVNTKSNNATEFVLSIAADQELIDKTKKSVLKRLSATQSKLPGFRAGKAPLNLVEKSINQDLLHSEFLEEAVNRLFISAVKSEGLKPVAPPKITLKKFVPFTVLEFEAQVEAIGEVKLPNYKTIKMKKPEIKLSDKDVSEVINSLKTRLAERKKVARVSRSGDEITFDFKGTDEDGKPINGAEGKDYPIMIGSNTFIPGFEPNLVGLKASQEKTFKVVFPKDYGVATLQNKKVTFWIKVGSVSEVIEPKVDDAFAAKAGPFKSLSELKADIKKQLTAERQAQADQAYQDQLVKKIADKSSVAIPGSLIENQVNRNEQTTRQNVMYRGQTWQEFLKQEGVTEEEYRERLKPEAQQNVKAGLVLSEIADKENLVVTPEELEIRIQLLKGQYKDAQMQAELDKPENRRDIEGRILTEKTVARLVSYATS